jgi:triacylglycerol lipase
MKIGRRCFLVCVPGVLAGLAALVLAVPAAADPALRVPKRKLNRALHCHPQVRDARTEPVLLLTGTGAKGTDTWASEPDFQATLRGARHPSCYLNFPRFTTGDMRTAAEYVVNGIRVMRRRAGRRIGVYGISQGALLPRWAVVSWQALFRRDGRPWRRGVGEHVSRRKCRFPHESDTFVDATALATDESRCPRA